MNIIQFLIILIVAGAALYIIDILPFINPTVKRIIQVIGVVIVVIYALKTLVPLLLGLL
jgi:hypothetical protein